MMEVHRFSTWLGGGGVHRLCESWNTSLRVVASTKQGRETSSVIRFRKELPEGDALYLRLNPLSRKLKATEDYRLSTLIRAKVHELLYVEAASEGKLDRVIQSTKCVMCKILVLN